MEQVVVDKIEVHISGDLQPLNFGHSFVICLSTDRRKRMKPVQLEIVTHVITHFDH